MTLAGQDSLHDEGQAYAEKLKNTGVEVELHDYPNARHNFMVESSADARHAVGVMAGFLNDHLIHTDLSPGPQQTTFDQLLI